MSADFFEYDTLAADSFAISCMEFDAFQDLLWIGTAEGRVTSFYAVDAEKDEERYDEQTARWGKYTSFAIARDPVLGIIPVEEHAISLSKSVIAVSSKGGRRLASILLPAAQTDETQPEIR